MHFVDPSLDHNRAILVASECEFWDIVEMLMEEPQVNPWDPSFGITVFENAILHCEWTLARKLLEHPQYNGQYARELHFLYEPMYHDLDLAKLATVKRIRR